jgi:hypothetical protein
MHGPSCGDGSRPFHYVHSRVRCVLRELGSRSHEVESARSRGPAFPGPYFRGVTNVDNAEALQKMVMKCARRKSPRVKDGAFLVSLQCIENCAV